jgi:hypothetical protein
MSWLSNVVNSVRNSVDKVGIGATQALPTKWRAGGRTAFRYGIASMGGGMGFQYEYSRNKGMNSSEATTNSLTGGYMYSQARTAQITRVAGEEQAARDQALTLKQQSDEEFARGQTDVTSRRRRRAKQASTKGGTLLTGAQGLVDTSTTGGGAGALLTGG